METMKNFFSYDHGYVVNKELGKLISYGYDLHEKDFNYDCDIPAFSPSLGSLIRNGMKTKNGGIYGLRCYRDHTSDVLITQIGVFTKENDVILKSYFLQTDNYNYDTFSCKTRLIENDGCRYFGYDVDNKYSRNLSPNDFIEAMVMLGFDRDDVINVALGKLTAREAFKKVAPASIRNIEWIDIGRKKYVFDGNVAISGDFGGVNVDSFPFPFDGQPIFDCSKVSTWYLGVGDNKRGAKFINVNANRDSIRGIDLRNVVIDEPIYLSLVDATGTIFGHQVVLYPECSIAPLNMVNLALATDEYGRKYVTDVKGHIVNECFPETEEVMVSHISKQIRVCANADNGKMAEIAIQNGADGIGLVRTENVFSMCCIDDLRKFMYYYDDEDSGSLNVLRRLLKDQIEEILFVAGRGMVVIRLLDFKFDEFFRLSHMSLDDFDFLRLPDTRGAKRLYGDILKVQLDVLMELASKFDVELNILVPLLDDYKDFKYIRDVIIKNSQKFNISRIRIGAMIENRYSVNYADEIARMADFISIGTNDLTESVTGVSRISQGRDFQILSDKVKEMIMEVIYRVRAVKPGIEVGICGEHINYVENIDFLCNLNIEYVTCDPTYVKVNQEFFNNFLSKVKVLQRAKRDVIE